MSLKIVEVAVEQTAYHFDKTFAYTVPKDLEQQALPGTRVLVPFGLGNKKRKGFIVRINQESEIQKIKPIVAVLDKAPLLNSEMIKLALWLKEMTFCTLYTSFKALIPSGINLKLRDEFAVNRESDDFLDLTELQNNIVTYIKNNPTKSYNLYEDFGIDEKNPELIELLEKNIVIKSYESSPNIGDLSVKMVRFALNDQELEAYLSENKTTPQQRKIINQLKDFGIASVKELCYFTGVTKGVITTLNKKGVVEVFEQQVYRNPIKKTEILDSEIVLTEEQQQVYEKLKQQYDTKKGTALLHGITGSGKTQIFLCLAKYVLSKNKNVIIMVPEISLTPQTIKAFYQRFGDTVAVIHSGLSVGERVDEWKRVKEGKARVIVGTRSASLAPVSDLGLIIVDEEHEHTYKAESSPRYNAKNVAEFRCKEDGAMLLLASATPSVDSYYKAQKGKYQLYKLKNRYGNVKLPEVEIVDMRMENSLNGSISLLLEEQIRDNLSKDEQVILLQNRRGYNTFITCPTCNEPVTCPNCNVSLTYHKANNRMMCHYCGYSIAVTDTCKKCGSKLKFSGVGTQNIEQEITDKIPEAKILRLDTDTTFNKHAYEDKLKQFKNKEYNILLGTQMVAKGLDFPNVTLVGVISADQSLYSDDFKSFETTFSLLTQVVGRAGRGEKEGRALIQTYTPDNDIIRLAANQDYESFYKDEILTRKLMLYPPFCDLCIVTVSGMQVKRVTESLKDFYVKLVSLASNEYQDQPLRVMGASNDLVRKINNNYYNRIIIKCKNNKRFRNMMKYLLVDFGKNPKNKDVFVSADFNPVSIL